MKLLFRLFFCVLVAVGSTPFKSLGQQLLKQQGIFYFRDSSQKLTITELQQSGQFRPLNTTFFSFGKDSSNHWLRFELENKELFSKEIVVEINQPYLDSVSFYVVDANDRILKKIEEGWKTHYKSRSYPHRNFVFKSVLRPTQRHIYFVRIYKKYMHVTGEIKAWEGNSFLENENREIGFMGLFMGFLLTNFVISILLFTINKDRLYAYYALYILFSGLSTLMVAGYFFSYYQDGFWGITKSCIFFYICL